MRITERGTFRSFEMDDFEKWAHDPRFDDERSELRLVYPLQIQPSLARKEGQRLAVGNPLDETYRLDCFVCASSPESHMGPFKWAIDFLVPDGTPVLAAHPGTVVEIQEHSDSYGNGPEYRDALNYLTIDHGNGEFTQYCHLAKDSVSANNIQVGSFVKQGQQIAVVGKTGWTDRDHLHFIVFRTNVSIGPFTFKSLKPSFKRKWWLW
jgi:murein DD-endopeptidase MepM/ murein hydrolase activator NlpD